MLQHYKILTVTHQQTSLNEIGKFILSGTSDEIMDRLAAIRSTLGLSGIYYTATCNRVLFVFTTKETLTDEFKTRFFNLVNAALSADNIQKNVQNFSGTDAVQHLFAVASSINSLVIGERQILGQLRESYDQCYAAKLINDDLRLLFQRTVVAAKDVYTNTRIGEKSVSVVSLAIQRMLQFKLPKDARIVMIGAGQTNNLVTKFLKKHEFTQVDVFNRSIDRAKGLANKFSGEAYTLDQLPEYKKGFDCIFICTAATEPVLTSSVMEKLLNGESLDDKIVVDLSVPYNTSAPLIEDLQDRFVEIEGLRVLAQANMAFREQEIHAAQDLLDKHLDEFQIDFRQRQMERAMKNVPAEIKNIRHKAINEVFRKEMELLDDDAKNLVGEMLLYMEKRCIGIPMKAAREILAES